MATHMKWRLAILAVCALCLDSATSSQQIMKQLTAGFTKALQVCRTELNLGDHIMADFMNFWREEYELVNRDLGCAISCIAGKLELLTDELTMHHDNAKEFAMKHGADEDMAKQLVTMIHDCEKSNDGVADDCDRVLEITKCFRTKIHELKWAPSMEIILEEIMTEI
ncbi:general odorant-binding protein 1-like [Battus philenor]|uniref:general odorant-binding protein 1-like n=1 Tax=Battus philenor TaxID=42288 RepID=UPI0035CF3A01